VAETPVEVIIRARNEAQAALNQAIGQLKQLETQSRKAGASAIDLRQLNGALATISPAASQAASQISSVASAAGALGPVAGVVAGLGAALGIAAGGAVLLAKNLGDTVEQLDNLSRVTGVSVDNLQVLQELFKRAGLDAEVARTALFRLNQEIDKQNPLLARLGVSTRDPFEALLQLSDAFRTSSDAAARAHAAQELLGRGGKDLLAVLDGLRQSFPELRSEMEQTGQLMGTDMVEAGRKFDREWEKFTGRFEGFMNRVKGAAAEAANDIIDTFTEAAPDEALARHEEQLQERIARLRRGLAEAQRQAQEQQEVALFNVGGQRSGLSDVLFGKPQEQVEMFKKKVAEAELQLGILQGTVREFGQDDLPQMVSETGAVVDVVAKATAEHEKASAAVKKHAAQVQELVDLFGMQRSKAEEVIRAQEALERADRKRQLSEQLFFVPLPPLEVKPAATVVSDRNLEALREFGRRTGLAREEVDRLAASLAALEDEDALLRVAQDLDPARFAQAQDLVDVANAFGRTNTQAERLARTLLGFGAVDLKPLAADVAALQRSLKAASEVSLGVEQVNVLNQGLRQMANEASLAELSRQADALEEALRDVRAAGEGVGNVGLSPESLATLTAQAEALRQAALSLSGTTFDPVVRQAEALHRAIQALGSAELTPLEQQVLGLSDALEQVRRESEQSRQIQALRPALTRAPLTEEQHDLLGQMINEDDVRQFKFQLDDVLDSYNIFTASMQTISQALFSSFQVVFQNMISSTQTFGEALKTIMQSIVSAVLSILAQLAAAKLLKFALSLLGGPGGGAAEVLGAATSAIPIVPGGFGPGTQSLGTSGAQEVGSRVTTAEEQPRQVTYNISTLDAHSLVMSLQLPTGSLRRAGDRINVAGAY
jgi:hypothetical protein